MRTPEIRDTLRGGEMISADVDRDAAFIVSTAAQLIEPAVEVTEARLVATAHGVYEARVNGTNVSDALLSPGWTAYEFRLQVQDHDVTDIVRSTPGDRVVVEATIGNGWYRADLGFDQLHSNYGTEIGFLGALVIRFRDGREQVVHTDRNWSARRSEVTRNYFYDGETIDARLRGTVEAVDVHPIPFDAGTLVEQEGPEVLRQEVVLPQRIWQSPTGRTLVDFGQNLVGWTRFTVRGRRGDTITIRHAEVLENGELGTRPLRHAKATDVLVLSGDEDHFEPTMTTHGFRYAEVTGWPGTLQVRDLEAVVVHSDMRRTGRFLCSDPQVNRLVTNSVWSQKGNFLEIPTDCPQRDERLGWTGDIAAYAPTACFQFDSARFLDKWLQDVADETAHHPNRVVPIVVPDVTKMGNRPAHLEDWVKTPIAVWADAAVWVPEALWTAYGDTAALERQYRGIVLHLESVEAELSPSGLWDKGFQLGDWLDPDAPPDDPAAAKADPSVVATACLFRSASFATTAAEVLGRSEDAAHWQQLAQRTREAFNAAYVQDGIVQSDCATVYALALHFGLLEGNDASSAADRLSEIVRAAGYRVSTGFAGTPYVTWALSEHGHVEDAYRLLLEKGCPSWLYPVTMGATTIWERWDSMLPDGSINPGEMTSFNHYALGAIADWIYQVVGGIRPGAPGYSEVLVRPQLGPGISWASTSFDSPRGPIGVDWEIRDGEFNLSVRTPIGVPTRVVLPDGGMWEFEGGARLFGCAAPDPSGD